MTWSWRANCRNNEHENQTKKWDNAEHLKIDEDMAMYLEACLEEAGDDTTFIAKALSSEGDPSFATILKVTRALGIKPRQDRVKVSPCGTAICFGRGAFG